MVERFQRMSVPMVQPAEGGPRAVQPEQLLVVCAWCGLELFRPADEALRTTHSICESCAERVIAENSRGQAPANPLS